MGLMPPPFPMALKLPLQLNPDFGVLRNGGTLIVNRPIVVVGRACTGRVSLRRRYGVARSLKWKN